MRKLLALGIVAGMLLAASTASGTVFLYEDFEGELDDWFHVAGDLWHQESYRSYSGERSLAYNWGDPFYDYWTNGFANFGIAWSPTVDVTGASAVHLDFASWLETENAPGEDYYDYDIAHVEIYDPNFNYAFTFTPDVNYFEHGQWNALYTDDFKPTLDLYGLSEFRVGFYFDTVDWMFNEYEGWYVDDVLVHDGQAPPIPEPSTWLLLSTGLVGAVPFVRRKFRR